MKFKEVYKKNYDWVLDEFVRDVKHSKSSVKNTMEYLDKTTNSQEEAFYFEKKDELEEYSIRLQNFPSDIKSKEDFLFVEGSQSEKFKKQYVALRYAHAFYHTEKSKEEIDDYYKKIIDVCDDIETRTSSDRVDEHAKRCREKIDKQYAHPVVFTNEEASSVKVDRWLGFIFMLLPLIIISIISSQLGRFMDEMSSILSTIAVVFSIPGLIMFISSFNQLNKKKELAKTEYNIAIETLDRKTESIKQVWNKDRDIVSFRETAKIYITKYETNRAQLFALIEKNKEYASDKLDFMPKITLEELDYVVQFMEEGEVATYSEALKEAKLAIERENDRRKMAEFRAQETYEREKFQREMRTSQEEANARQLEEARRQTRAMEDAAAAAQRTARASEAQATATEKAAKDIEKYGKKTSSAAEELRGRAERGDFRTNKY